MTTAVPVDWLRRAGMSQVTGQPLCPQCRVGYLHPYVVEIGLEVDGEQWRGADYLVGWVAVCVGNEDYVRAKAELYEAAEDVAPSQEIMVACGFSMPMAAKRRARPGGESA